ncbi:alpha/beta fold hydrolase [Alkalibacter saccharofermentans]|uniref:Pimeloyl-ACP methyl ester carboxylesterase n=1 Tax=Alkalibacter saccharofermentans DSM 14828 TaxID=1120975 RepID=A0A1M4WC35_9FIRM|nr:alpha/beta hydrolase [Alkalibacter saccharofermentans]SHE78786.1 Pimeloyl-ACP methyl ester carboxylesterase [Alkalibacter saccharofermentans DSM 14828]
MFTTIGVIFIIIFVAAVVCVFALMINHNNRLKKEAKDYPPPGNIVEVNNKKMHVYAEGEGEITLIFMAGHGTSNPTIDFKPIWMRMKDEYRIAVVEKSGYGWSDASNSSRDIDTILEETRKALEFSREKAPFVLFPHSMSGLEAIYWAQKYPDEVKAIIGLDPCTPEAIDILPMAQKTQLYSMYFISRIGLSRFMTESDVEEKFPLMKSSDLTEEDKLQYMAVFLKSSVTKDMLREIKFLKENAQTVKDKETPLDIPMYFFISGDQESVAPGWGEALTGYLSHISTGKYQKLEASHYVHYENADLIVLESKKFLELIK